MERKHRPLPEWAPPWTQRCSGPCKLSARKWMHYADDTQFTQCEHVHVHMHTPTCMHYNHTLGGTPTCMHYNHTLDSTPTDSFHNKSIMSTLPPKTHCVAWLYHTEKLSVPNGDKKKRKRKKRKRKPDQSSPMASKQNKAVLLLFIAALWHKLDHRVQRSEVHKAGGGKAELLSWKFTFLCVWYFAYERHCLD